MIPSFERHDLHQPWNRRDLANSAEPLPEVLSLAPKTVSAHGVLIPGLDLLQHLLHPLLHEDTLLFLGLKKQDEVSEYVNQ